MCLAFSSSRFCLAGRSLPPRLMWNWIILMPEPIPLGLTFLLAIVLATVSASLVKMPSGGNVETVFTFRIHRLFVFFLAAVFLAAVFLAAVFLAAVFLAMVPILVLDGML